MSIAKAWTPSEIDCVVGLYLIMRTLVERGEKFNKRALIREQQAGRVDDGAPVETVGLLVNRTRQSVEMKLMNITAVMHDIGRDDLSMAEHGYRPLNSYQAALKERVKTLVADCGTLDDIYWNAVRAATGIAVMG